MRQYHEQLYQELLKISKDEVINLDKSEEYEKEILTMLKKK